MNEQVNTNQSEDMERVTWFGYQSFIFSLTRALTIGLGTYFMFSVSQVDTYISSFLGFILSLIPFGMFVAISKNSYELDIIDLNTKLFGKILGTILNAALNIVFLFLCSLILYIITQYINIQYIPNTSSLYIKILIVMPVIYAATKNIATIARISQVIIFFNLGLYILSVVGLIEEFKVENLLPVFSENIGSVLWGAIIFAVSIVVPIFLMTIIPQSKVEKKEYKTKKMFLFYIICVMMVIFIIVTTLMILGIDIINIYRYPIFMSFRQFSLFTIIEKIEKFLALQFVADIAIFLILGIYFIATSMNKVVKWNKKENIFSYLIGTTVLVLSIVLFKDGSRVNEWLKQGYVYILSIGILLPMLITFLGLMVDKVKGYMTQNHSG